MDIFTDRFNELIKINGITKYRLAKDLGVSKAIITYWCNGSNEPKISYLKAIADYFGVCSDYLLSRQEYY